MSHEIDVSLGEIMLDRFRAALNKDSCPKLEEISYQTGVPYTTLHAIKQGRTTTITIATMERLIPTLDPARTIPLLLMKGQRG